MLIVKIMSAEDAADEDTRKSYRLLSGVEDVRFERGFDGLECLMWVSYGYGNPEGLKPESFQIVGNVYVMNESGRTISSFGSAPLDAVARAIIERDSKTPSG